MKSQLHRILFILFGMIPVLSTGCGGGGGDDDDDGGNVGVVAPNGVAGRRVDLMEADKPVQTIVFASAGNGFTRSTTASAETGLGTYAYAASGSTATLTLTDSGSGATTTFQLTVQSSTAGEYTFTNSDGRSGNGRFSNFAPINPGGNPPGPGNGGGGAPPPPGNEGGGLEGRVMVLTRSTGQTHTYTFTGNRFVDSDPPEEGSGTYTYLRTGSQAALVLNYTGSAVGVDLVGDRHDLVLNFSEQNGGSYTSTYTTNEGATLSQDGVFQFFQ